MRESEAAAIVPAYNEEASVGAVVRTLVSSGAFREVLVVDDGSSDRTAEKAQSAGARVIRLETNMGKGAAISRGAGATDSRVVCFFDADLVRLAPEHVLALVRPVADGKVVMNVGLVDRGAAANAIARRLPLVSGQRAMLKEVLDLVPRAHLTGYGVEVALNFACKANGLRVGVIGLPGVSVVRKTQKVGLWRGLLQYARMWFWVGIWMIRVWLDRRHFVPSRGLASAARHQ